jgi:serine/threonine protein kinase
LFSDQYSLAVTYQELLTGVTPFQGRNLAQLTYLVTTTDPDLSRLPAHDQPAVARAMSREPRERFPSCLAFLDALAVAAPAPPGPFKARSTSFEFTLGDMNATTEVPVVRRTSSVYRRATRVVPAGQAHAAPANEPLAGYQLLECLARGQAGELWRARSPRGEPRRIRFLVPPAGDGPNGNPLARLKQLRHPALAKVEVTTVGPDRLALVSEAAEDSLADLLKECHARGQPGIPRADLLAYLGAVAQALDEMYHTHQLQHLALTPRHIGLKDGQPLLVEFGLAELLWLPDGLPPGSLSPRYSAVEMFEGLVSDACDQFSLALMFQELLVGVHPYRNLNARQMASPKLRGQPDVSLLPGPDRPIILQALDPAPERRFRSCAELISALQEVTFQAERAPVTLPAEAAGARPAHRPLGDPSPPRPEDWRPALKELVHAAGRGHQVLSSGLIHYRLTPGVAIEHRCRARLAPGMARLKMAGFREQWRAELIDASASRWRLAVKTSASVMDRCLGRTPSLLVEVVLGTPRDTTGNLTPVRITVEPADCGRGRAGQVLEHVGPMVLASLQKYLSSQFDLEEQERYPLAQAVRVHAPAAGLDVAGRLRDVGRQGLTALTDKAVPAGAVSVTLNRWASPVTLQACGWVRDCLEDGGEHEVEVAFGS